MIFPLFARLGLLKSVSEPLGTNLLHTQQVDQARVLAGLALDLTCLVVALGNGSGEVTISWNHDEGAVSLGGTCDHVLDEVTVAWSINDCVVPLLSVELLCGACNGHTTLALFLLTIHVEGESERAFAQSLSLLLQLLLNVMTQLNSLSKGFQGRRPSPEGPF